MSPPKVTIIGAVDLTILDDDTSVGGVWSKARLYPGLIADSANGLFEFSDETMVTEKQPIYKLIPGSQIQSYLEVTQRRSYEGWRLFTGKGGVLECSKLIVASGLYSKPYTPDIPGQETFEGLVLHSKELGASHQNLATSEIKSVIIIGGRKSAIEAANICFAAKKHVHWIVRPSDIGVPFVLSDPDMKPNLMSANQARIFSIWSPSIFSTDGFWYRFLHSGRSALGNRVYRGFWRLMSWAITREVGYEKSANGKIVKPGEPNVFRTLGSTSLLQKGSNRFLEELHSGKNVTVHRAGLKSMTKEGIILDNDEVLEADAVVFCTGWRPSTDYFSDQDALDLGLPVHPESEDPEVAKYWTQLLEEADEEMVKIFPHMADGPRPEFVKDATQFRLYREILFPKLLAQGDRSIAFAGFVSSSQTAFNAEIMALWAVAWLEWLMPKSNLPTESMMDKEVARTTAWMGRRYRSGIRAPEIVFESQSYFDVLVADLGLEVNRKQKGFLGTFKEWVIPYMPHDYAGIIEEYTRSVKEVK
ncbi:FAD/NAD(P)-binding domain-containing protein [Mytilinidion resinicola]|uniref:FAD/NAD(P)-binding domain-containing protein n=1 Tax=Mytilinidion resinicola TaxID=574789 RepID=A0A6A6Z8G8_9PEZI|nr:FAD/NAD(P)-binding domain-containing protein [Mytilinidion resinicola]KAF2817310.1 FAD/NAD(P)-binding domain-containing protein [Mytilinidion resinicola]